MVVFEYETLKFRAIEDGVRAIFMKFFYFDISSTELECIGDYSVENGSLKFSDQKESSVRRKFERLISNFIKGKLKSVIGGSNAYYINEGPLIGSQRFGILDSDSNCLEIRPVSGCNLACTFCSVDEGPFTAKTNFYVDKDLLVEETRKLCELKGEDMMIWIGSQGDPTLYYDLVELIRDLKKIKQVKYIAMVSNGVYLNNEKIDELVAAGLDSLHVSICSINKTPARKLAGVSGYNVEKVLKLVEYAAKKMQVVISPVYLSGENDNEIIPLIEFANKIGAKISIQNFFEYRGGRNPVKGISMEDYNSKVKKWGEQTGVVLEHPDLGFKIKKLSVLEKPFKKGDIVKGHYFAENHLVVGDRLVFVHGLRSEKGEIKVKILRDKHNIFIGEKL